MDIQVVENVLKLNDELASLNRQTLHNAGLVSIDVMGAPGCGKTALIQATIPRLTGTRAGVIVGDLATQRDAQRLAQVTPHVVQINTGKTCHLEAHHVRQAIGRLDLAQLDLLFIENVGNLICPVGFDLGQDAKVGVFAVTDGDDKAAKHPYIVTESDVLILSKIDLLSHVPFDIELFRDDVKRLNPRVSLLEVSATTGQGFDAWVNWLLSRRTGATDSAEAAGAAAGQG
jgi:hydrogenase nickel incorporation protein HypB